MLAPGVVYWRPHESRKQRMNEEEGVKRCLGEFLRVCRSELVWS